ncbi:MAG: hypothetical protein WCF55_06475, partial [Pseudolabrys sp.]
RITTAESLSERNSVTIPVTCFSSLSQTIQGKTATASAKTTIILSRDALQEFDFRLRLEDDAGEDINTIALALFST